MRAAFQELRDRAIKRGIVFGISFDSFERLAKETLYLNGKGNGRSRITIDRKNNRLGYVDGNLQPLTREENARKAAPVRRAPGAGRVIVDGGAD